MKPRTFSTAHERTIYELDKCRAEIARKTNEIYDLNVDVSSLRKQIDPKETLRCSGCGRPLEVFFTSPEVKLSKLIQLIRLERKIDVIKLLRTELQWSLTDTKYFVDMLFRWINK